MNFDLEPNGVIIVRDDDDEPCSYLHPEDSLALCDFLNEHRATIEKTGRRHIVTSAMSVVHSLLLDEHLPQPKSVSTYFGPYDITVDVDLSSDDDLTTWAERLGCDTTTDAHPSLGHRRSGRHGAIVLTAPWDRIAADAAVTA